MTNWIPSRWLSSLLQDHSQGGMGADGTMAAEMKNETCFNTGKISPKNRMEFQIIKLFALDAFNLLALQGEGTYFSNFANTSATMVRLSMALSTCPLYSNKANMFLLSSMARPRISFSTTWKTHHEVFSSGSSRMLLRLNQRELPAKVRVQATSYLKGVASLCSQFCMPTERGDAGQIFCKPVPRGKGHKNHSPIFYQFMNSKK